MYMRFAYIIAEKKKIWFIPSDATGLVEADLESGQCVFVGENKGQVILATNLFGPLQKLNSDIVIAPVFAEDFYKFNLDSGKYEKLRVADYRENFLKEREKYSKFQAAFSNNGYMYFIGFGYSGIVKIDTKTWDGQCINIPNKKNFLPGKNVGIYKETAYIPIRNKNIMLLYHLDNDQYETLSIGTENYIAVCVKENKLCCVPGIDNRVVIYDISDHNLQEVHLPYNIEGKKGDRWYCTAVSHCNFVWIFPFYSNMIMRLDMDTGNAICVHMFDDASEACFLNAGIYDENKVWGFEDKKKELVLIDCKSLQIERKKIVPPQNMMEYINIEKSYKISKTKVLSEGYLDIKGFIRYILSAE